MLNTCQPAWNSSVFKDAQTQSETTDNVRREQQMTKPVVECRECWSSGPSNELATWRRKSVQLSVAPQLQH